MVKSAPVSKINCKFNGPSFVWSVAGIKASGIEPKVVTFLRSGNSINADGTLRSYVLDEQ